MRDSFLKLALALCEHAINNHAAGEPCNVLTAASCLCLLREYDLRIHDTNLPPGVRNLAEACVRDGVAILDYESYQDEPQPGDGFPWGNLSTHVQQSMCKLMKAASRKQGKRA